MLERIHQITSVGLLCDTRPAAMPFRKMTFIYGDNGRGKSTLASILRSYNEGMPEPIIHRRTLGSALPQMISLQFSQGNRATFSDNVWNGKFSDINVFDLDFVERNVYSGGEISAGHRKRLLSFALGKEAVAARTEFNEASGQAEEAKKATRTAADKLASYRGNVTLSRYIKASTVADLDDKISKAQAALDICRRTESIRNRVGYQPLPLYAVDLTSIFATLASTYDSLSVGAEDAVGAHITRVNSEGFERWASSGLAYVKEDICPFCTQNLTGIELIKHYREKFNQAYRTLIRQVAALDSELAQVMRTFNMGLLESKIEQAQGVAENWKDCLHLSVTLPNYARVMTLTEELLSILQKVIRLKKNSPLTQPAGDYESDVELAIQAINEEINIFNTDAVDANDQILTYKQALDNQNEADLQATLAQLEAIRQRQSPAVQTLIDEYVEAKTAESAAVALKESRRNELNSVMDTTLGRYEGSINDLLMKFGASFRITEINYNYAGGGEPKSEYAIELRGEKISLTGEGSSFRNSLSEGDKRTLAFAFFIAVLFHDQELNRKIVVIDDPMCSLDNHRRNHTISIIKQAYIRSLQVIILAHDLYFLRALRDEFLKMPSVQPQDTSALRIVHTTGQFSDIARLDIDLECESPYYKNHRIVSGFVEGTHQSQHDTAVAIRPLLEGYLHRRFPGRISAGNLFGEVIAQITQSQHPDPLFYAQSLVTELNEINNYAGRFHHDTNPAASAEMITTGELMTYSRRALEVIYRGHF